MPAATVLKRFVGISDFTAPAGRASRLILATRARSNRQTARIPLPLRLLRRRHLRRLVLLPPLALPVTRAPRQSLRVGRLPSAGGAGHAGGAAASRPRLPVRLQLPESPPAPRRPRLRFRSPPELVRARPPAPFPLPLRTRHSRSWNLPRTATPAAAVRGRPVARQPTSNLAAPVPLALTLVPWPPEIAARSGWVPADRESTRVRPEGLSSCFLPAVSDRSCEIAFMLRDISVLAQHYSNFVSAPAWPRSARCGPRAGHSR